MGFNVPQGGTQCQTMPIKRMKLFSDQLINLIRRQILTSAAKVFSVSKTRMRADSDAQLLGPNNRLSHGCIITGVVSTGDIG